jgi:hypothetical protein
MNLGLHLTDRAPYVVNLLKCVCEAIIPLTNIPFGARCLFDNEHNTKFVFKYKERGAGIAQSV